MKITENKLRYLIRSLLLESLKTEDISLINGVIDKLNFASKELMDDLHQENREEYFSMYIVKSMMRDANKFIDFITKMLIRSVITSQKVKKPTKDDKGWDYLSNKYKPNRYSKISYEGLSEKIIYDAAHDFFKGEILPIEDIVILDFDVET